MRALKHAITLHQVHAFERNIQAGIIRVLQKHELATVSAGFDLAKALELADAVIHVDHVVAGLQLGKIAEETGGANLAAGPLDSGCDIEQVRMAKKCEPGIGKRDAFRERRADQQQRRGFASTFRGEARSSVFRFAEHVGDFIFAADIRKALDFSRAGGGQEHCSTRSKLGLHVFHASYNIAMKARARPR